MIGDNKKGEINLARLLERNVHDSRENYHYGGWRCVMARARKRVAVVGLLTQGRKYVQELLDLDCDVVGVDIDEERRKRTSDESGIETHSAPDDAIGTGIDGAVVTTPNKYHIEPARIFLDEGMDIFVEKPLAHSLEAAQTIATVANESEGRCLVGFEHRCHDMADVVKRRIDDGYLGDIVHVECRNVCRRGIPGLGQWYTARDVSGGGAIMDLGAHSIDLLNYFLGFPNLEQLMGMTWEELSIEEYAYDFMFEEESKQRWSDVEQAGAAIFRFEDCTASMDVSWATNQERRNEYFLRGTDRGAYLDLARDELAFLETSDAGPVHHGRMDVDVDMEHFLHRQMRHFVEFLQGGDSGPLATLEEGMATQEFIELFYRSDREGTSLGPEAL
jgi:predicted dehydrogenase